MIVINSILASANNSREFKIKENKFKEGELKFIEKNWKRLENKYYKFDYYEDNFDETRKMGGKKLKLESLEVKDNLGILFKKFIYEYQYEETTE